MCCWFGSSAVASDQQDINKGVAQQGSQRVPEGVRSWHVSEPHVLSGVY